MTSVSLQSGDGDLIKAFHSWHGLACEFPKEANSLERLERVLWLIASGLIRVPGDSRRYIEARVDIAREIRRKSAL